MSSSLAICIPHTTGHSKHTKMMTMSNRVHHARWVYPQKRGKLSPSLLLPTMNISCLIILQPTTDAYSEVVSCSQAVCHMLLHNHTRQYRYTTSWIHFSHTLHTSRDPRDSISISIYSANCTDSLKEKTNTTTRRCLSLHAESLDPRVLASDDQMVGVFVEAMVGPTSS